MTSSQTESKFSIHYWISTLNMCCNTNFMQFFSNISNPRYRNYRNTNRRNVADSVQQEPENDLNYNSENDISCFGNAPSIIKEPENKWLDICNRLQYKTFINYKLNKIKTYHEYKVGVCQWPSPPTSPPRSPQKAASLQSVINNLDSELLTFGSEFNNDYDSDTGVYSDYEFINHP